MVGIDFGTTNSSVARLLPDGRVELAQFPYSQGVTETFRSLLYLEKGARGSLHAWAGPRAIEHYLQAEPKGRLVQSLKSFLSNADLKGTEVFGRFYTVEELIARMLREIRQQAETVFGAPVTEAVVGKPVRFVGSADSGVDELALGRLRIAFEQAGFARVEFAYEPLGAACHYESMLDHEELILIGDFGGGTSDFSLLRVGPRVEREQAIAGHAGLGFAGDAFDAKIVRHLVSPALGAGTKLSSMGKLLPVPGWVYNKLERWHHLSFLRSRDVMHMLDSVRTQAEEPEKIDALMLLIEEDLGLELHRAVQETKVALSQQTRAPFHFGRGDGEIRAEVARHEFEDWIEEELDLMAGCVDGLLVEAGVAATAVDAVFLTGGTSLVPAVRRIFEHRFGAGKIRAGGEFTSVARGLAMLGAAHQAE